MTIQLVRRGSELQIVRGGSRLEHSGAVTVGMVAGLETALAAKVAGAANLTTPGAVLATASAGTAREATVAEVLASLGLSALTAGALLYATGAASVDKLALGTAGRVLVAGASAPAWSDSGLSYASGVLTVAGSVPGTPSSGQVLVGGGAVKADGALSAASLTATGLTSGRVSIVTTGGLLADSPTLTFSAQTLGLGDGTGTPTFGVLGAAGTNRTIAGYTGSFANSARRWLFYLGNADLESGANAGSNVALLSCDDAGNGIDIVFKIFRVAGGNFEIYRPLLCTGAVTFPNGTVASPGIRTSENHGLFRNGATSLGISVAGVATQVIFAPNGSSYGGNILLANPTAGEVGFVGCITSSSACYLVGSNGPAAGGQVRAFGNTHATKANYVEFTRGATVSAYFNGSGKLRINGTTDGILTVGGKITAKAAVPGSFADLAEVQSYLASIFT